MKDNFELNKIIRNTLVRIILSNINISPKRNYYDKVTGHGSMYIYYWERFYHGEYEEVAFRQVTVARISNHQNAGILNTNIVVQDIGMNLKLMSKARNVSQIILNDNFTLIILMRFRRVFLKMTL